MHFVMLHLRGFCNIIKENDEMRVIYYVYS